MRRRERRRPAIAIDQRPVPQMHVGIADQRVERQAADEFGDVRVRSLRADDLRDVAVTRPLVLVGRIDPEDLRKILDVNGPLPGTRSKRSIASAFPFSSPIPFGRLPMSAGSRSSMRGTSMPMRRASVIMENSFSGTPANSREGSLTIQDPPTPAAGIVESAPCFLERGELELNACQGEAKCGAVETVAVGLLESLVHSGRPCMPFCRHDGDRARQVPAERPQQEEFALGIHARPLGEIGAHVAFGKKVREDRQKLHARRCEIGDEAAQRVLEGKAERGAGPIRDVRFVERKEGAVARDMRQRRDGRAVQPDVEDRHVSHCRPRPAYRRASPAHCPREAEARGDCGTPQVWTPG